jgi:hypothetical protein
MTPLVWANFPAAALFVLAFAGGPLWLTFRRGGGAPDHSEARHYLAARSRLAQGSGRRSGQPVTGAERESLAV